ncbi:MAG: zinc ABC transporter permease subunit ZnuB [Rhodospirillales bacterium]|nr:MAG: zinc ABC transporter permease subunit ZnuB [Rhodospirillales bacterium]
MLDDFFTRALLAGIGVALAAGPLGCFIVWRRMAYFGDTMAHSALLGVALGFALGIDLTLGVVMITTVAALLLVFMQRAPWLSMDTLLGIMAHSTLSIGLIAVSLMAWLRIDLMAYLFGDILAVGRADVMWIYLSASGVLVVLAAIWRPLLAVTVHEDLARAEGVPAGPVRLLFMLLIAVVIAFAMKVVGILLITSLLIIPAAAARRAARTPERMAVLAALIGAIAVILGLHGSLYWDLPSGPAIVTAAALLFLLSLAPRPRTAAAARPARSVPHAPAPPKEGQ